MFTLIKGVLLVAASLTISKKMEEGSKNWHKIFAEKEDGYSGILMAYASFMAVIGMMMPWFITVPATLFAMSLDVDILGDSIIEAKNLMKDRK